MKTPFSAHLMLCFFLCLSSNLFSQTSGRVQPSTNSNNPIYFNNGRAGIGTPDPQSTLDVNGSISATGLTLKYGNARKQLRFESGGDAAAYSDLVFAPAGQTDFANGQAASWWLSHRKDGYFSQSTDNSLEFYGIRAGGGYFAPLAFKSNGDVILTSNRNAISGDVGIGLTIPEAKLHVNGTIRTNTNIVIGSNPPIMAPSSPGSGAYISLNAYYGNESLFRNLMVVRSYSGGGIGGSLRQAGIQFSLSHESTSVESAKSAHIILETTNSYANSPSLNFYTKNTQRATISNNGDFGIGIATPQAKLHVNGNIRATEIQVLTASVSNLNVDGDMHANNIRIATNGQTADFVFESDYNLRSLQELEGFIIENKHLPEIPSATDMESNGVDLAEMNKLLLMKVEELTLYMIEQQKAVLEHKTEINSLKDRLNNL